MSLPFSVHLGLFPILLILSACEKESPKVNNDPQPKAALTQSNNDRYRIKDIDSHPSSPMNMVQDYRNNSADSEMESWIILSKSAGAGKAREIFEREISNGNYIFQNRMISEYIKIGKNKSIPKNVRIKYLIDALWTWQRLPPNLSKWDITSPSIPKETSDDLSSQSRIQDIIVGLNSLE